MTATATITDALEQIQCGCERADYLRDAIPSRDGLIRALDGLGFGRPGQAVPTDWRTYYGDDELREFILGYAEQFSPAA
jgi:hypothetical protein